MVLNIVLEHQHQVLALPDNVQIIQQPQKMMNVKLSWLDVLLNMMEVVLLDHQEPVLNNKELLQHALLLVVDYKLIQNGQRLDV